MYHEGIRLLFGTHVETGDLEMEGVDTGFWRVYIIYYLGSTDTCSFSCLELKKSYTSIYDFIIL